MFIEKDHEWSAPGHPARPAPRAVGPSANRNNLPPPRPPARRLPVGPKRTPENPWTEEELANSPPPSLLGRPLDLSKFGQN
jgi:hypothetical protein